MTRSRDDEDRIIIAMGAKEIRFCSLASSIRLLDSNHPHTTHSIPYLLYALKDELKEFVEVVFPEFKPMAEDLYLPNLQSEDANLRVAAESARRNVTQAQGIAVQLLGLLGERLPEVDQLMANPQTGPRTLSDCLNYKLKIATVIHAAEGLSVGPLKFGLESVKKLHPVNRK